MFRNRHRGRAKKHYVKRSFLSKLIGDLTTPAESEDYDVPTEDEVWTLSWGNKEASTAARPVVTNPDRGPDVGSLMNEKVGVKMPATGVFNIGMTSSTRRALIEGSEYSYSLPVFNYPKATTNAPTPLIEGIVAYSPPVFKFPQATTIQAPNGLIEGIVAYSPPGKAVSQLVEGATDEVTGSTEGADATTVEASVEAMTEIKVFSSEAPTGVEKIAELVTASITTEEQTSEVVSTTEVTVASSTEQKTTELPRTFTNTEEQTSEVVSTTEATVASSTEQKTTELPTTFTNTEEQTSEVVSTTEATVASSTEQKTTELPTTFTNTEEQTIEVVSTTEITVAAFTEQKTTELTTTGEQASEVVFTTDTTVPFSTEQKTTELPTTFTATEEQTNIRLISTTGATVASFTEQTTEQQTTVLLIASSEEHTTEALPTFSQTEVTGTPSVSFEAQNTESVVAPGELQSATNTKAMNDEFQTMLTENQEFLVDKFKLTSAGIQITSGVEVPVAFTESTGNLLEMTTSPFSTSLPPQPPYKLDNDIKLTPVDQIKFEETTELPLTTTHNVEADKPTVTHVPTDIYDLKSSTIAIVEDESFTTLSIDNDIEDVDEDEALDKFVGMQFGKKAQGFSVPHKSQYLSTEAGKEGTESIEDAEFFSFATTKKGAKKHKKHHWHFGKKKTTVDDENDDAFTTDVFFTTVSSASRGNALGVQQSPTFEDTNIKGSGVTLTGGFSQIEEGSTAAATGHTITGDNKSTTETEESKLLKTAEGISSSVTSSATEEPVEESKGTAETKESQLESSTNAAATGHTITEDNESITETVESKLLQTTEDVSSSVTSSSTEETVEESKGTAETKESQLESSTNAAATGHTITEDNESTSDTVESKLLQTTEGVSSSVISSATENTAEESKGTAETKESQSESGTTSETENTTGARSYITIPGRPHQSMIGETSPNGREYVEGYVSNAGFKYYGSGNGSFSIANAEETNAPPATNNVITQSFSSDYEVSTETTQRTVDMISAIDDVLKIFTGSTEPPKGMPEIINETFVSAKVNQPQYDYPVTAEQHTDFVILSSMESIPDVNALSGMADMERSSPKTDILEFASPVPTLSHSLASTSTWHDNIPSLNAENLDYDTNNDAGATQHNPIPTKHQMGITITYENGKELLKLTEETLTLVGTFEHHRTRKPKHKWFGGKSTMPSTPRFVGSTFTSEDEEEISTTREADTETIPPTSASSDKGIDGNDSEMTSAAGTTFARGKISKNYYGATVSDKFQKEKEYAGKTEYSEHEFTAHEGSGELTTEINNAFGAKNTQSGKNWSQLFESKENHLTTSERYVINDSQEYTTKAQEVQTQSEEFLSKNIIAGNKSGHYQIPDYDKNAQSSISINIGTTEQQDLESASQQSKPDIATSSTTPSPTALEGIEDVGSQNAATEQEEFITSTIRTTLVQKPTETEELLTTSKSTESKADTTTRSSHIGSEVSTRASTYHQNISGIHTFENTREKTSSIVGEVVLTTSMTVSNQKLPDEAKEVSTTTSRTTVAHEAQNYSEIECIECKGNETIPTEAEEFLTTAKSDKSSIKSDEDKSGTKPTSQALAHVPTPQQNIPVTHPASSSTSQKGSDSGGIRNEVVSTTFRINTEFQQKLPDTQKVTAGQDNRMLSTLSSTTTASLHLTSEAAAPGVNYTTSSNVHNVVYEITTLHTQNIDAVLQSSLINLNQDKPTTIHTDIGIIAESSIIPSGTASTQSNAGPRIISYDQSDTTEILTTTLSSTESIHVSSGFSEQSSEESSSYSTVAYSSVESSLTPNQNFNLVVNNTDTHQLQIISVTGATTTGLGGGEYSEIPSGKITETILESSVKGVSDIQDQRSNETNVTRLGNGLIAETTTWATAENSHSGTEKVQNEHGSETTKELITTISHENGENELSLNGTSNNQGAGVSSGVDSGLHAGTISTEGVFTFSEQSSVVSLNPGTASYSSRESSPTPNKNYHLIVNDTNTHQLHIISMTEATPTDLGAGGGQSEIPSGDRIETNITKVSTTTEKEEESALSAVGNNELGGDLITETSTEDTTKATHEAGVESTHSGTGNKTLNSKSQGVGVSSDAGGGLHVEVSTFSKQFYEVSSAYSLVAESSTALNENFNLIVNNSDTHQLQIVSVPATMTTSSAVKVEHSEFTSGNKTLSGIATNDSTASDSTGGGGHSEISAGNKNETNVTKLPSTTEKEEESALSGVGNKELGGDLITETSTKDTTKATHEISAESTHSGTGKEDEQLSINESSTSSNQPPEVSAGHDSVAESSPAPNKNFNLIVNDTNTHQLQIVSVQGAMTTSSAEKGEHLEYSLGDITLSGVTTESTATGLAGGGGNSEIFSGNKTETHFEFNETTVYYVQEQIASETNVIFSSTTHKAEESALSGVGNKKLGDDSIAEISIGDTTKATHEAAAESTHSESTDSAHEFSTTSVLITTISHEKELSSNSHDQTVAVNSMTGATTVSLAGVSTSNEQSNISPGGVGSPTITSTVTYSTSQGYSDYAPFVGNIGSISEVLPSISEHAFETQTSTFVNAESSQMISTAESISTTIGDSLSVSVLKTELLEEHTLNDFGSSQTGLILATQEESLMPHPPTENIVATGVQTNTKEAVESENIQIAHLSGIFSEVTTPLEEMSINNTPRIILSGSPLGKGTLVQDMFVLTESPSGKPTDLLQVFEGKPTSVEESMKKPDTYENATKMSIENLAKMVETLSHAIVEFSNTPENSQEVSATSGITETGYTATTISTGTATNEVNLTNSTTESTTTSSYGTTGSMTTGSHATPERITTSSVSGLSESTQHVEATTNGTKSLKHAWNKMINKVKQIGHGNHSATSSNTNISGQGTSVPMTSTQISLMIDSHTQLIASINAIVIDESKMVTSPTPTIFMEASNSGSTKQTETTLAQEIASSSGTTNKEDKHVTLPGEHVDASAGTTGQLIGTILQSPEHKESSTPSSSTSGEHLDRTTSETLSSHHSEHIDHTKEENPQPTQVGESIANSTQEITLSPIQSGITVPAASSSPPLEHGPYDEYATTSTKTETSEHVATTYSISPSPMQSSSNYPLTTSRTSNLDVAIEESADFLKITTHVTPVIILHSTVPDVDVGGAAPAMPVNIKLLLEEANRVNQTQTQSSEEGLYHSDITTVDTTSFAMQEGQSFSPESASLRVTGEDHATAITDTSAPSMADESHTSTVSAVTTTTSTLPASHEGKAEELKLSSLTTLEGSTASNLLVTTMLHESSTFPSKTSIENTSSLRPEDTTKSHETLNSSPKSYSGKTIVSTANIKSEPATNLSTIEKHVLTTLINPPILLEEHQNMNMHHLSTKADVTILKQVNEHLSTEFGGLSKDKITSAPSGHKEQTLEPSKEVTESISETELTNSSTAMESTTLEDMHTTEEINYVTNARSHASEVISTQSIVLTSEHDLGTTSAGSNDLADGWELTSHVEISISSTTKSDTSHTQAEVLSVESSSLHDWNLFKAKVTNVPGEHLTKTFDPAKQALHFEENMSNSSEVRVEEGVNKNTNTPSEHSESTHLRAEMTEHSKEQVHSEFTTEHEPITTLLVTTNLNFDKNANAPGEHSESALEHTQHSPEVEVTGHSKGEHGTPKVLFSTNTPEIIHEEHQNLNMHHFSHTSSATSHPTTISEETETTTASEHHKASKKHKHLFKHKSTTSLTTDESTSTSTTEAFYLVGNETCKYTPVDKSKNFNMTKTTTRTTKSVYINLPTYFLNSTWPVPRFELYYPTHPEETTEIDESFDRTLNPHAYRSMKFADFVNITEFSPSTSAHVRQNVSAFKDIPINTTTTETTTEMTAGTTIEITTANTTTTTESTATILTTTESSTESTEILTTTTSEATTTETTEPSTESTTILTTTTTSEATTTTETTEPSTESTTILTTTTTSEATTTTETTEPSTESTTILTTTTTSEATTTLKPSSPPTQASALTIANVVSTDNEKFGAEKAKTCNLEKDKNSCICSVDSMVKDLQEKSRDSNISAVLSNMCEIYIPLNSSGIKVGRCVNRLRRSLDDYDWDSLEPSKPKREVIASADIKDALNKDIQLDESESHRFATPGSQVRMICADGKNFTSKNYNIKWTVGKDTPLTGAKTLETETGDLVIQNVEPSDCGNYTCTVTNHQVGMRAFQHKLSVVALPTMDINTTILYEVSVECLKEDEELLRVYFNTAIGNMLCGKEHRVCSIDIVNCTCINKQKKYLSVVLTFHMEDMHVIVPTLNTTQCNVACQMKIYAKLISVIVNNILVFETQPIIYKHSRDVMLTPSKDASLAAQEISDSPKLIIACNAGYGLLGDKHICSACEKNTYNNGGQARCIPCPPRHYQPYSGSRLCIRCTSLFQDPACMNLMMLYVNKYKYYAMIVLIVTVFAVLCIICVRARKNKKHDKRANAKNKMVKTHYDVEMQAVETHDKETVTLSNKPSSTKRRRRAPVKARAPPIPVQREAVGKHASHTMTSFMMTNCMDRRTPPTPPTPDFD